jgi:hypothetical protein
MFCPDYEVITQTQEGGCPNHRWRKKEENGSKDNKNDTGDTDEQKEGESSQTGQ